MADGDLPTLPEAAAVMKAVDAYASTLGEKAMVIDMLAWLDRLSASIELLRSVTRPE